MTTKKSRKGAASTAGSAAKKSGAATKGRRAAKKAALPEGAKPVEHKHFPIVGIGASAGGLEALEGFVDNLPPSCNMAFIIIQHLAVGHKSIMGSLLEKHTRLKISEIEDGMAVEPGCIYLNPPDKDVDIINGVLHLTAPEVKHATRLPIDYLFRSLAADQADRAICIVLSGTGTDGTLGLKAIKGEGGMAMVQDENQAKYSGMPASAISTGLVDFILPVEKMPAELLRYAKHPFIQSPEKLSAADEKLVSNLQKIFLLIRTVTGHDFSNYKQNTIRRRIERRMAVHQIEKLPDYIRYLRQSPIEVKTLSTDLLITVTNFFRDREAYDVLTKKAVKEILKAKEPESTVRVWVPGCASGEEAYSMAMLFVEGMESTRKHLHLQVFATDLSAESIESARSGVYPDSIAADVSPKRLKRFFIKEDGAYRVKKQIRDMLVFAVHNLIKDPPFSKLDLVSCRNVLIYMNTTLQHKIIPLFHYTLNRDGYLFLGSSETIGKFSHLFTVVDSKWKVFKRKGMATDRPVEYPLMPVGREAGAERAEAPEILARPSVKNVAERIILEDYSWPCVLVNQRFDILYFHGKTDKYLSPPTGEPRFNILKMASDEIGSKLSIALHQAFKQRKSVVSEGIPIKRDGETMITDIIIRPVAEPVLASEEMMMVIFEERPAGAKGAVKAKKTAKGKEYDPRVASLEAELRETKEYLQTTVEELETSNEEMKSANEELQSTNEELQSTNEELETSKEELHSTNEELETVNSELQGKVDELSRAHNDLQNLLTSTDIGTIFLDSEMRIKRFTPAATRLFNLIKTDIGRPLADIAPKIDYDELVDDSNEVVKSLARKEIEVLTKGGCWFSVRILPYRTLDNVIDGVVLTFTDISRLKHAETLRHMEAIVNDSNDAITVQELDGTITSWNKGAEEIYGYPRAEAIGMNVSRITPGNKRAEALEVIERIRGGETVPPLETKRVTKDGRALDIYLTATRLVDENGKVTAVATTERDITDIKRMEAECRDKIAALESKLAALEKK